MFDQHHASETQVFFLETGAAAICRWSRQGHVQMRLLCDGSHGADITSRASNKNKSCMPPRRRVRSSERDAMCRPPVEFAHRAHDTHTQWKHRHKVSPFPPSMQRKPYVNTLCR